MTEKNYTHKIVMFDVNSAKRVAYFESKKLAEEMTSWQMMDVSRFLMDSQGTRFNLENIVQMNPIEENKHE